MNTTSIERTAQDSPQKPAEQQVNRACEACRLLKVRCLPDGTSGSAICQRCKKSGRICIYAAPQKRRQRIRTDTRVAELEREIRAMRSLLTGGSEPITDTTRGEEATLITVSQDPATPVDADTSTISSYSEERSLGDGKNCSRQSSIPSPHSTTPDDSMLSVNLQPSSMEARRSKDFGLLSPETSNQLFESYNNDLVQHYPAVIFPKHTSPDYLRKSKPVLFQAVVTAAACQLDSVLFGELFREMTKVYAERILVNGEKSLELIQSLILTSIWYCPPNESCGLANLHFYQYIHMAATMALDLGIGLVVDKSVVSLDECRSLLVCYLNCAGIALRMRRPNLLQWTSGMSDCLDVLENSPEVSLLDKRLAAWVRLQNIVDDWSKSVGLINSHVELSLKGFERQLQKWREVAEPGVINISLVLAYHQDSIYLHESALESGSTTLFDFNHKVFKPASVSHTGQAQEERPPPLTAAYVNAVMSCINSSHALLDEFLSTDIQSLRVVPIIHFVRASYAIVVLVKLFVSASVSSNELGKILDRKVLKVDYYMEALLGRLAEAAGPGKLRVPTKWLTITQQVSDWYHKHLVSFSREQKQSHIRPDAQGAACSANSTACGVDAIRPSDVSNPYPSWKVDSFPTVASLQEHASRHISSDDSVSQPPYENTALPVSSNILPPVNDPTNYTQSTFTHGPSSQPPADLASIDMDFTQDDLSSFLDIPSVVPAGAFNGWMPDDGMLEFTDMSYESSGGSNWGFDFR